METVQKYLEQDLFIEIKLHYKRKTYYAWGEQERIEKYFSYKIKDLVNTTSQLVNEENNYLIHSLDEYVNDNIFNSYEDALTSAAKECDKYISENKEWMQKNQLIKSAT